jgi:voltage-gated potassium channel
VHNVFFITVRRLRAPLILIILIFAFSTAGLALIPGVDAEGKPWRMTLFQAFYFVTYTATTVGFGEIPYNFTDQQRFFVLLIIYSSVIGWAYLLGSFLGLAQDKALQQTIVSARFQRAVGRLREPFYLVCGLGETGVTVLRALDKLGQRFAAIDREERKVQELEIEELSSGAPLLAADARSPETLTVAGLLKPECKGVLALCNDDAANLAITISASLLRPDLPVVSRADSPVVAASMMSLGTYRVINPFREFGSHLELAMRAPDTQRLLSWLTSTPGTYLAPSVPPRIPAAPGHWIVCGYGRFGNEVVSAVQRGGFKATIIDPTGIHADGLRSIKGIGTGTAVLHEAGVETASGLFAGTDDDTTNLAIAIAARRLNPGVFIIVRQNLLANHMLFARFGADMTMIPSQIIANECIAVLRTPLLAEFLDIVRHKDDFWAYSLSEMLRSLVGVETPAFWSFAIGERETSGFLGVMKRIGRPVTLADLSRSPDDRRERLPCLALLLVRGGEMVELPPEDFSITPGDRLLFAGQHVAASEQSLGLQNANVAAYVLGDRSEAEGWIWRKLQRSLAR